MDRDTKIQHALSDLRSAFAESLRHLERDVATDAERVSEKIEKRKEFARSIDLSARIFSIYDNIKYYPSWSQHCPDNVCPSISNVRFEKPEKSLYGNDKESLDFEFKGKRWSFAFENHRVILPDGADGGYSGRLSLVDSAKNLLFEGCYEQDEYSASYKPHHRKEAFVPDEVVHQPLDIEAFVPGDWTVELLELSEEIAATRRESDLKHQRAEHLEQRQRFGLVTDDSDLDTLAEQVRQYATHSLAEVNPSNEKEKRQGLIATLSARYSSWTKNKRSTE